MPYKAEIKFEFTPGSFFCARVPNIIGHHAQYLCLDANTFEEALKIAESRMGTNYNEKIEVSLKNNIPTAGIIDIKKSIRSRFIGTKITPSKIRGLIILENGVGGGSAKTLCALGSDYSDALKNIVSCH